MKKKLFALSSALLLTVSLAACGSDSKASGTDQTVDDACSIVTTEFESFTEKYSSITTEVVDDPSEAIPALEELKTDLGEVTNKISNTEVLAAWESLVSGFNKLIEAATSEDTADLTSAITELTEGTTALKKVCPEISN